MGDGGPKECPDRTQGSESWPGVLYPAGMNQGLETSGGAVLTTDLALPGRRQGKVRDVYDLPRAMHRIEDFGSGLEGATPFRDGLLVVASDRISAFDVVMPTAITGKGRLLTELSTFWLGMVASLGICRTHLVSTDVAMLDDKAFKPGATTRDQLAGRTTIARKAQVVPIECVVRGYLEGSGWKEYQATGSVCGAKLPAGLKQCSKLPEPIFTPATKEEMGKHDENVSFERASQIAGSDVMERLRRMSLAIYREAANHAWSRGIIIADTKFEFGFELDAQGRPTDELLLIDEALTPDSSRFWPLDDYEPGRSQKSFDKQYLREYLETLVQKGTWNKSAPGPQLPDDVVQATVLKYREAMERLID